MTGIIDRLNTAVAQSFIGRWFMLEGSSHPRPRAGTRFSTEVRAGFATFVTMAYIISVNAMIISDSGGPCVCDYDPTDPARGGPAQPGGLPQTKIAYCGANQEYLKCVEVVRKDLIIATAAIACLASTAIGITSNLPLGMAPGMGINAYFAYTVVGKYGTGKISYQQALAAVFIEGIVFLILSIFGLRQWLARSIPRNIKVATEFVNAMGACESHRMESPTTWMGILGMFLISLLVLYRLKGAILIGILVIAIISWPRGTPVTYFPYDNVGNERFNYFKQVVSFHTIQKTLGVMEFDLGHGEFWLALVTFLYVDILDTTGTMFSMAQFAGFMDPKTGDFEGSTPAFITDAICVSLGAVLGTSDVTAFVESGAGITEGGRTGLMSVTTGICFFISLFFAPIFSAIPPWATGPALIFVGSLMVKSVTEINFNYIGDSIPAFLTMAMMPLTYNIAYGLLGGLLAAVVINGTVWLLEKLSRGKCVPPNKDEKDPAMSFRMGAYGENVFPPWLVRLLRKLRGADTHLHQAEDGRSSPSSTTQAGVEDEKKMLQRLNANNDKATLAPPVLPETATVTGAATTTTDAEISATTSGAEYNQTRKNSIQRHSISGDH
ncbi:hypothetical protein BGW41_006199 [Actinomortierella wolfii]|nr:hypothetical protein BGW41_006199 [Actinomortierella wolfii]